MDKPPFSVYGKSISRKLSAGGEDVMAHRYAECHVTSGMIVPESPIRMGILTRSQGTVSRVHQL